jgi:hypothetical protein
LLFAIDWTFQVIKSFVLPGAKVSFTMNTETGEIATMAIVESTSVDQIAHAVEQVHRRPNFSPKAIFTDTWPANKSFWTGIFGEIVGVLGLFHFMHRLLDTLRPTHSDYWEALDASRSSIYMYYSDDLRKLYKCLADGEMSNKALPMSQSDISKMRHSKLWKQRYGRFLRKRILDGATIAVNLAMWKDRFSNKKDPRTGYKLFTEATAPAVANQIQNAGHV